MRTTSITTRGFTKVEGFFQFLHPTQEIIYLHQSLKSYFDYFFVFEKFGITEDRSNAYILLDKAELGLEQVDVKTYQFIIDLCLAHSLLDRYDQKHISFEQLCLRQQNLLMHSLPALAGPNATIPDRLKTELEEVLLLVPPLKFYLCSPILEICLRHLGMKLHTSPLEYFNAECLRVEKERSQRGEPNPLEKDIAEYPAVLTPYYIKEKKIQMVLTERIGEQTKGINWLIPVYTNIITTGSKHTFLMGPEKTELYACGSNNHGQIGRPEDNNERGFHLVDDLEGDILLVACGFEHSIVLTTEGLFGAGNNYSYQLGISHERRDSEFTLEDMESERDQLDVNYHTHMYDEKKFVKIEHGVVGEILSIACSEESTFLLTADGLYACGNNNHGQLGMPGEIFFRTFEKNPFFENTSKLCKIACGRQHTVVLDEHGRLYGFGCNAFGQLGKTETIEDVLPFLISGNVCNVWCGAAHTMYMKEDEQNLLYYLGAAKPCVLSLGPDDRVAKECIIEIPMGVQFPSRTFSTNFHTMVVDGQGVLYGNGKNECRELGQTNGGNNDDDADDDDDDDVNTKKVKKDPFKLNKIDLPEDIGKILAIHCGECSSFVLTRKGLYVCGKNESGQLGTKDNAHTLRLFEKVKLPFSWGVQSKNMIVQLPFHCFKCKAQATILKEGTINTYCSKMCMFSSAM